QGSQWLGMGRTLFESEPIFRRHVLACDDVVRSFDSASVIDELFAPEASSRLSEISVVQPVLFAMATGLAELFQSWGIVPAAVLGHSMGEVGAAYVSGVLTLEDAAKIICRRSKLLSPMQGRGGLVVAEISREDVLTTIERYGSALSI